MTFDFFNVPRIVFGRGVVARLPEFVPQSARALLVYNGKLPERVPRAAEFRQRGEPTIQSIDEALNVARFARCDFVIGFGGGSAIDAAKAVAGLLSNGGGATDYMEVVGAGRKITQPAVPWIAIPTTAGTGAEVTRNAVVGWPEKKFKASIRSELLMARVAVIDPELGVDVPPDVTARGGMDALCQCVEAYVSKNANPLSDAVAIKGVELCARHLPRAYANGADVEAREAMALAALCSGIALTNAGLGAVHGFAAPLGANYPVPHGVVCGVLLPLVIDANIAALDASGEQATLLKYRHVHDRVNTQRLLHELHLPRLGSFGLKESDVVPMVALAQKASSMKTNPIALTDAELAHVLRAAL